LFYCRAAEIYLAFEGEVSVFLYVSSVKIHLMKRR